MELLIDDAINLVKRTTDPTILAMRKEANRLELHYFGGKDEVAKYLERIEDFENTRQFELRTKLAISNEFIVDDLLKPADNVWSAKGGSRTLGVKGAEAERFLANLSDVSHGYGIRKYMQDIWNERFIVDPNGLIFVENTPDRAYLTFKSIKSIKNYKTSGYEVEYVVFEDGVNLAEEPKEEPKDKTVVGAPRDKFIWVVDDKFYRLFKVHMGDVTLEREIVNIFGKVPAVVTSGLTDTKKGYKVSIINKQLDLLDSYLVKNSRKEVFQNLHDYPIPWEYETTCPTCNGAKKIDNKICSTCEGSGMSHKKDVSTVRVLKNPQLEEPATPNPPAGYVAVESGSIEAQRTELDWLFELAFFSRWGASREKAENETATGRFIDVQPVNNSLNIWSDIAQTVEAKLTDLLGKFYFPETYGQTSLNYGRRYLIETPDQVWDKYTKAKEAKVSPASLNLLLMQFYEAEFQNDPTSYSYYLKLMDLEPFVHATVDEVMNWPVDNLDRIDKAYFSDWLNSKTKEDIIKGDIVKLKKDLRTFVSAKQVELKEN